jgi:hypothetical protein
MRKLKNGARDNHVLDIAEKAIKLPRTEQTRVEFIKEVMGDVHDKCRFEDTSEPYTPTLTMFKDKIAKYESHAQLFNSFIV